MVQNQLLTAKSDHYPSLKHDDLGIWRDQNQHGVMVKVRGWIHRTLVIPQSGIRFPVMGSLTPLRGYECPFVGK